MTVRTDTRRRKPGGRRTGTRRDTGHCPGRPSGGGRAVAGRAALLLALVAAALTGCAADRTAAGPAPSHAAATAPAASGTPSPAARSVPVRLEIPAIGVDAPVMTLGLNPDGTVAVPPIEADAPAGWYRGSPTPGQLGPSVILGHVTVGAYGDGVFRHLDRLRAGDGVSVRLQDGETAHFTVDEVRTVAKAHFPTSAVYGNVDRPALRLITCGGARTSGGYPDNVIVFASLTSTV